jgi:Do/DeqQ family serine protease
VSRWSFVSNRPANRSLMLAAAVLAGGVGGALVSTGEARLSTERLPMLVGSAWATDPVAQSDLLADVAESALASVVNISVERRATGPGSFGHGWGPLSHRQESGQGSGVVVSANGVVVTNHHVVDRAEQITVRLSDGREFSARVVGSDEPTDLAVLQLNDATDLTAMPFGDSDTVRVGEMVMAIGNPFGLSGSVSLGIVSAMGRSQMGITDYDNFIQTDAAVNPGNSGGALVNMDGELVGINTAILSRSGGSQGVGFAIPSSMVQSVVESLQRDGRVVRGWLGIGIQDITPALANALSLSDGAGVLVSEVEPGGPAHAAGLRAGDVVLEVRGEEVHDSQSLRTQVALSRPGDPLALTVLRNGQRMQVEALPGERPNPDSIASLGYDPKLRQGQKSE